VALVETDVSEKLIASLFKAKNSEPSKFTETIYVTTDTANYESLFALKRDAICFSETSVPIRAERRHISEDSILHFCRRESIKNSFFNIVTMSVDFPHLLHHCLT
jgi:hypothetical protein